MVQSWCDKDRVPLNVVREGWICKVMYEEGAGRTRMKKKMATIIKSNTLHIAVRQLADKCQMFSFMFSFLFSVNLLHSNNHRVFAMKKYHDGTTHLN